VDEPARHPQPRGLSNRERDLQRFQPRPLFVGHPAPSLPPVRLPPRAHADATDVPERHRAVRMRHRIRKGKRGAEGVPDHDPRLVPPMPPQASMSATYRVIVWRDRMEVRRVRAAAAALVETVHDGQRLDHVSDRLQVVPHARPTMQENHRR